MKLPLYALLFPASQAALLGVLLTLLAEHGMTAGMWILMILLSVLCTLCDWLLFRTLKQLTLRRLTEAREQALAESVTMQEHRAAALEKEARVAGGYLTLRVVNSAPSAPVRRPRAAYLAEHGWGLSIVETLAGRSGGRMVTEPGDGKFAVTVWLRAEVQTAGNGL